MHCIVMHRIPIGNLADDLLHEDPRQHAGDAFHASAVKRRQVDQVGTIGGPAPVRASVFL